MGGFSAFSRFVRFRIVEGVGGVCSQQLLVRESRTKLREWELSVFSDRCLLVFCLLYVSYMSSIVCLSTE